MIRVLQYIGSLELGGSQTMIMNIYRNINREQIQFDFVIHADGKTPLAKEAESYGAVIYTCPQYRMSTAGKYSKWWKQFFEKHQEYKIVHSHVRSTAAIVLRIAKQAGCTTIAHSHSTSSGGGIKGVVKSILQYRIRHVADYFMGCSQKAGEWLFGKKVCSSDRYFNVVNAIDTKKYAYDLKIAEQARFEFGFSKDDVIIGHVGRFSEPKNHSFLIDVFSEIHSRNQRYKLLLVGDGELRDEIEKKVKQLKLDNSVVMTGVRTDVNRLMMAMDVFVFPSKYEGLGIVLIEAQATGCPCIASDVVPEEAKITNLVTFFPLSETVECWAEKVLRTQYVERKGMSEIVREKGFDITKTAAWMQNFYLNCAVDTK